MTELLNDAVELADFLRFALQRQVLDFKRLVGSSEQLFELQVVSLNLHKLVLVLIVVGSDGFKTFLQTFDLFTQVFDFFLQVSHLSLLACQHFLTRPQVTPDLLLVILEELNLLAVAASLALFVMDDLVVRLCISFELGYLGLGFLQARLQLLLFLFKFKKLA